jgi:hypothetical protein
MRDYALFPDILGKEVLSLICMTPMTTKLKRELTRIAMRYRLSAIFAFGSRSADAAAIINRTRCSGEYSSSDIDVGVLPLQGVKMGPREKVRLTIDLEDLLRVKKVDCPPFFPRE